MLVKVKTIGQEVVNQFQVGGSRTDYGVGIDCRLGASLSTFCLQRSIPLSVSASTGIV